MEKDEPRRTMRETMLYVLSLPQDEFDDLAEKVDRNMKSIGFFDLDCIEMDSSDLLLEQGVLQM